MTTMAENERLAVLESQYKILQSDVTEIKSDVKAIAAAQATIATALAVREAAEFQDMKSRSSTGVWVRTFLPLAVATLAVIVSIVTLLLNMAQRAPGA